VRYAIELAQLVGGLAGDEPLPETVAVGVFAAFKRR
jgi:hypothetical protein